MRREHAGRGFHGDSVGREIEEGVLWRSWPSQSPQAEVFLLQTPKSPRAGPGKVNSLLTLSLSLVSQPKPSNQGVQEKNVHRESKL